MRFAGAIVLGLATIQGAFAQNGLTPQPSVNQPAVTSAVEAPTSQAAAPTSQAAAPTSAAATSAAGNTVSNVVSSAQSAAPTSDSVATGDSSVVNSAPSTAPERSTGQDQPTSQSVKQTNTQTQAQSESATNSKESQATNSDQASATGDSTDTTLATVSATGTRTGTATGTGTATTSGSKATSTTAITAAKLDDAQPGQNANITKVDGEPAVVLTPPANGQASFSVDTTKPADVKEGEQVRIVFSIQVQQVLRSGRRRSLSGRDTDPSCQLKMSIDGATAYDAPINTGTSGTQELASNAVQAGSKEPKVDVSQVCNDKPVSVTFTNLSVTGANSGIMAPSDSNNSGDNGKSSDKGKDNAAGSLKTPALWATCVVATLFAFLL